MQKQPLRLATLGLTIGLFAVAASAAPQVQGTRQGTHRVGHYGLGTELFDPFDELILSTSGTPLPGRRLSFNVSRGPAGTIGCLLCGTRAGSVPLPQFQSTLLVAPGVVLDVFTLGIYGSVNDLAPIASIPLSVCGLEVFFQAGVLDASILFGAKLSRGLRVRFGASTEPGLFPNETFEGGGNDVSMVSGDLDADGVLDLVQGVGNTVSVFFGLGGGLFGAPFTYTLGFGVGTVVVGDFDGDAMLDVGVTHQPQGQFNDGFRILRGIGDGVLEAQSVYSVPLTAQDLAAGDLDGDGNLDVAVLSGPLGGRISVLLGVGDGTFVAGASIVVGGGVSDGPTGLAISDLNHDGVMDFVVSNPPVNGVYVYLGLGGAAYGPATNYLVGGGDFEIAVGDLDGNGDPDLVVAKSSTSRALVLMGNGDGSFGPATTYPVTIGPPRAIAVGEVTDDGIVDVIVAGDSKIVVFPGVGDGTLGVPSEEWVGLHPGALLVEDVDDDGVTDVVVGIELGLVNVLLRDGAGSFQKSDCYSGAVYELAVGDLDNNGTLDLATTGSYESPAVSVRLGVGDGTFGDSTDVGFYEIPVAAPTIADVNGDGFGDLLLPDGVDGVSIRAGIGDGTFPTSTGILVGVSPDGLSLLDLDGDGFLDLAATLGNEDELRIYLGGGTGTFGSPTAYPVGDGPTFVRAFDLNVDGTRDLVVSNRFSYDLTVLLAVGDGSLGAPTQYPETFRPTQVFAEDLDLDGIPELVVGNEAGVTVWSGVGDGTFTSPLLTKLRGGATDVSVADLSGDGFMDVVMSDRYARTLSVLSGVGDGSFAEARRYALCGLPRSLVLGDFDQDGDLDVAASSSLLTVLLNRLIP